jgi:iron(III) transport system permease protein
MRIERAEGRRARGAGRWDWPLPSNLLQAVPRAAFFSIPLCGLAAVALATTDARSRFLAFNTLKLVAATLALSLPLGTVLGLLIARTDLPLRRTAAIVLGLLIVVPLYLQAAAWQAGFGTFGWYSLAVGTSLQAPWLAGWRGAIFVHALAATPWVAAIVGLAARQVEPQLEEAALLDAPGWRVFWHVTLRRIIPAIGLATLWIALLVSTDMTVTDLYQVRTYSEEVYTEYASPDLNPWTAAAVVTVLAGFAILLCAGAAHRSIKSLPKQTLRFSLGWWRWPAAVFVGAVFFVMLVVPLGNLFYKAGVIVGPGPNGVMRHWSASKCWHIIAVSPERFRSEIGMSLWIATGAATATLLLAVPLVWVARRGAISASITLMIGAAALAIPSPLLAIWLIGVLNQPHLPFVGWVYHSTAAPMLGQAIRALPLAMLMVWFAFRTIPEDQFESAALDGARQWSQFWRIAIPQRRAALFVAWIAAFIWAFNELPATLLLQPPGPMTLSVAIYQLMHGSGEDRLAGIVLFTIAAYAAICAICFGLGKLFRMSSRGAIAALCIAVALIGSLIGWLALPLFDV